MRILSIDPGFERLGLAVLEAEGDMLSVVHSQCVRTSAQTVFSERLCALGKRVEEVLHEYKPDELAIETLLFSANKKTAMQVAESRGVVLYEAASHGLPVFEYGPMQIKIAITGYGNAPKGQIALLLPQLVRNLPQDKRLDDELDAIAVGITHCAHRKNGVAK